MSSHRTPKTKFERHPIIDVGASNGFKSSANSEVIRNDYGCVS